MEPATVTPHDTPDSEMRRFPQLTEKEEAFVYALLANGGKLKQAAVKAGYAKASAHVTASRVSRKPAVVRALHEASVEAIGSLVPQAIKRIGELGLRANSEHVQLEASKDILDRVGLSAPKQIKVGGSLNVQIDLS